MLPADDRSRNRRQPRSSANVRSRGSGVFATAANKNLVSEDIKIVVDMTAEGEPT